jgi:hypothetical protein
MNLELSDAETELLQQILQGRMEELREEVRHSRLPDFREQLKEKEELLRGIMEKLGSGR